VCSAPGAAARVCGRIAVCAAIVLGCGRDGSRSFAALTPDATAQVQASAVEPLQAHATEPAQAHAAEPASASAASVAPTTTEPNPALALTPGGSDVAIGRYGMVVSVEEQATRIGVQMLEAGGNAIDAAVATAYALAVTHPSAGNVGGGGFMLVAANGQPVVAFDFRERAPAGLSSARLGALLANGALGPGASGVPGSVAGLNLAQRRFGRLSLAQVMAPAIALARKGYRLAAREALTISWAWSSLQQDPEARRIFGTPSGPLRAGARLVQRDLAVTLERIARGGDAGFYEGPTARAIVAAMGETGLIRKRDLKDYRAVPRDPLEFVYRGHAFATMPPPSSGGVALAQTLVALESLGAHRLQAGSADELHLFVEVSKRAQARRRFELVDPDAPGALSPEALAAWLLPEALLTRSPAVDPTRATPAALIHALYGAAERELEHTTHLSAVDADGNAVSCTTTLSGGFGARYVVPGTGIVMNNSLAAFSNVGLNVPKGGRRSLSSMAPTLVFDEGHVSAVLGSPGGDSIPSTIVQVARLLFDHGFTIDRAIEAPRIHHGFVPDEVRVESERPPQAAALVELAARGHVIRRKPAAIGDANDLIVVDGIAYGHADTREGGLALGLNHPPREKAARKAEPEAQPEARVIEPGRTNQERSSQE
jgi:gamma-glutamyltranspeptidase / glutathione hydrolase